jgi:sugar phosphate permease
MALLGAWFVRRRRGLAAGIGVTGSSFALIALGPLVPRLLSSYGDNGWRVCWFVFAGATFIIALLALFTLRDHPSDMGLSPLGGGQAAEVRGPAAGLLAWGKVYRSGTIWHLGMIYVAFGFSYIIYLTFYTKYLVSEGGYTSMAAGRLFMLMGWLSLLCGVIWGAISSPL